MKTPSHLVSGWLRKILSTLNCIRLLPASALARVPGVISDQGRVGGGFGATRLAKALALGAALSGMLLTCGCEKISYPINRAAYFGAGGYADTTLPFSEFFEEDHTLTCWFMLQYPVGYTGLMLAENGAGKFYVGQGDWREYQPGTEDEGCKLIFQVGANRKFYPQALGNTDKKWRHLAVRRSGDTFTLFVNGTQLFPSITIDPNDPSLPSATSTLRLGRRTTGQFVDTKGSQLYGLLDDVAVFDRALSQTQIAALYDAKRLDGDEPGLKAAWNFDKVLLSGAPLPSVFTHYPLTFRSATPGLSPSGRLLVSPDRNSAFDAQFLPLPFQQKAAYLPFIVGQPWYVNYGFSTTDSSHRGYANFCWDLVRPNVDNAETCGNPVLASSGGIVQSWNDDNVGLIDCNDDGKKEEDGIDGPNYIRILHAENELCLYLHVKTDSVGPAVNHQTPPFAVVTGSQIAQVGRRCQNGCHLHTGLQSGTNKIDLCVPMAYSNYEASDNGKDWYRVEVGVPQRNQWVRNAHLLLSVVSPEIIYAEVVKSASGTADFKVNSGVNRMELRRLSLSTSNIVLHTAHTNLLPHLPKIRGSLTIPSLRISSSGSFTGAVDATGFINLTGAPLRVQGTWLFDSGKLGRHAQAIDEALDPGEVQLTAHVLKGGITKLEFKADLSLGSIAGEFTGTLAPDGTGIFALAGNTITLRSPFLTGGPGDYDQDGKVDGSDFNYFAHAFTGPITSNDFTSECLRGRARAEARVEIDPTVARPHPGEAVWDVQVLNDGVTHRSNWGNNRGNYDSFNGAHSFENDDWFALLLGPDKYVAEEGDSIAGTAPYVRRVPFNAFRYWRGPQFSDGGWWAGRVTVEVMRFGDPRNRSDVLNPLNWSPVARSDGSLGVTTLGPFATTPEPNDDTAWDALNRVHREAGDPPTGRYQFSEAGDADDERPYRNHYAHDGDGANYVARPDYLHFTFAETMGAGIRIRGLGAKGPGAGAGAGNYVSCAELQGWFNPTNAPEGFCHLITTPAYREAFDFDEDGDIDLADYDVFRSNFSGGPQIERVSRSGTEIQIHFGALPGRTYRVQFRDALASGNWAVAETISPAVVPRLVKVAMPITSAQRLYRLQLLP